MGGKHWEGGQVIELRFLTGLGLGTGLGAGDP